mgnify:CR=1 FL=1
MFPQTHKPTERMIDYGKIIYDHFKRRYGGHLQSGYRLYSEKRTASELPDVEFPDDIDPAKAPELTGAVIREVHQTL